MKSNIRAIIPLALLCACNSGGGGDLSELPPAPALEQPRPNRSDAAPRPADDGAPPPTAGPQGTSRAQSDDDRYDRVGHAGYAAPGDGVYAISNVLPDGSHAEVTALDSGKTIVVAIRSGAGGLLDLSSAAARQLGVTGAAPVRVRRASVMPQDAATLAAGQPLPLRADAPQALLAGLRKRLNENAVISAPDPVVAGPATPPRAQPVQPTAPAPPAPTNRGLFVQVAALSSAQRARALAGQLGGVVRAGGGVHRVQIGPFPNRAAAERGRADVARRGYGDAHIISVP